MARKNRNAIELERLQRTSSLLMNYVANCICEEFYEYKNTQMPPVPLKHVYDAIFCCALEYIADGKEVRLAKNRKIIEFIDNYNGKQKKCVTTKKRNSR